MIDDGMDRSFRAATLEGVEEPGAGGAFVSQILDCFDGSILIVDRELRILHANANALATLDCRDDETTISHYIVADLPSQSLQLRRRIMATIANGGRAVVALKHRRHGRLICSVKSIAPFGSAARQGLVSLTPADQPPADVSAYLCDHYKLSKAEAEIAVSASAGSEISQIMLDRRVSIHTLRTQIASIKAKMGLKRMTEIAVATARVQAAVSI